LGRYWRESFPDAGKDRSITAFHFFCIAKKANRYIPSGNRLVAPQ
jgi:hypothetical protein